jgi:acetylglutamate synthase
LSKNSDEGDAYSFCSSPSIKISKIRDLLIKMPDYASYVLTNVNDLIVELFAISGSGTFFKLSESVKIFHNSIEDRHNLNMKTISDLMESSFEKKLKEDYIQNLFKQKPIILVTESYSAMAIITKIAINGEQLDHPYLDKFCVAPRNQGHGLADLLFDSLRKEFKTLFWRSKLTNPINVWYFKQSQGSWKTDKWILFWYGLENHASIHQMIKYITNFEASFY